MGWYYRGLECPGRCKKWDRGIWSKPLLNVSMFCAKINFFSTCLSLTHLCRPGTVFFLSLILMNTKKFQTHFQLRLKETSGHPSTESSQILVFFSTERFFIQSVETIKFSRFLSSLYYKTNVTSIKFSMSEQLYCSSLKLARTFSYTKISNSNFEILVLFSS